jgi:hypothetical protein
MCAGALQLLDNSAALAAMPAAARQTLAYSWIALHGDGNDLSPVFGIYCLLLGWLVLRSTFLPRLVGALMALAGACYIFSSLADLLAPAFARTLLPHLNDPTLLGEGALALWLIQPSLSFPSD